MGLAQINIRFKADLSGFSTEMQNVSRKMQVFGTKMNEIGQSMSLYVTGPLLAGGAAAIKFASDYEESLNKVNVAFGSSSESVKTFAKDTLTTAGIAEGTALDMAAGFGDMATSMGLPQSAAAKMSTSLVGLAGDLASFKNIGIDQANTALAGIFTGETESLKKLGIVLTEANLQQFAYSKGIKVQIKDMDQASKVNLRYAYIMANTTNAQGDFVRTGGGAANQMRIFQESLKQLAQQFGSVILPAFTKMITYVNGLIKGFGELSPATKTVIVGVAAVAAAIGPLMVGLGNLIGIVPRLIVQFNALKATMLANPYTALAVGIAAVGTAMYMYFSSTTKAVSGQTALNDAIKKGNEAATSEVATLDKLYSSAINVKLSTNERKKAVDELQLLYPAYFKNIKDEVVLNGNAKKSYDELREAIFNKARAIAIDGELQNRANERVKKEVKLREDISYLKQKIEKDYTKTFINEAGERVKVIDEYYGELASAELELNKFNEDNLKADAVLFAAKEEYFNKIGKLKDNDNQKNGEIKLGTDAITSANERLIKSGTIEFFENQISEYKKLQKEQAVTNDAWLQYQNNIDIIQKKIDSLTNTGIKLPKPQVGEFDGNVPSFSVGNLEEQKAYYEELRTMFSTTSDEYLRFTDLINNTQIKINSITGVEELKTSVEDVKDNVLDFSTQLSSTISSGITDFATGFAETIAGGGNMLEGFGNLLFQSLGNMMVQLGKAAIEIGVGMLAIKAAFKTPMGAILAGGALILAGTLFKSLPAFAEGGITGGTSYYGDKILARVNSGEMIANKNQQKAIYGMMNSGSNVNVNVGGTFRVSGSDLLMLIDRAEKKKDRTG